MEWQSFAIEVKFKPRLGVMSSQAFIFRINSSSQKGHQRVHEVTAARGIPWERKTVVDLIGDDDMQ